MSLNFIGTIKREIRTEKVISLVNSFYKYRLSNTKFVITTEEHIVY